MLQPPQKPGVRAKNGTPGTGRQPPIYLGSTTAVTTTTTKPNPIHKFRLRIVTSRNRDPRGDLILRLSTRTASTERSPNALLSSRLLPRCDRHVKVDGIAQNPSN